MLADIGILFDQKINGVYGGDSYTDHLSYACIGCPYHTLYFREVEDGNDS
jgi:hypothetical protein